MIDDRKKNIIFVDDEPDVLRGANADAARYAEPPVMLKVTIDAGMPDKALKPEESGRWSAQSGARKETVVSCHRQNVVHRLVLI